MQRPDVNQEKAYTSFVLHLSIDDWDFCYTAGQRLLAKARLAFVSERPWKALTTIQTLYRIHYFLDILTPDCLFTKLSLAEGVPGRCFGKKRLLPSPKLDGPDKDQNQCHPIASDPGWSEPPTRRRLSGYAAATQSAGQARRKGGSLLFAEALTPCRKRCAPGGKVAALHTKPTRPFINSRDEGGKT